MSDDLRERSRVSDINVQTPAFDAYAALKNEFDSSESCSARTADRQRRMAVNSLPESEMQKLSVVWLSEKQKELGRDITRDDLTIQYDNSFDATMQAIANTRFDQVKKAQWNPVGGVFLIGSKERDAITSGDIEKSLRKIEDQRQSMQYVNSLVANDGELFNKLAKVHDGELSINYWDLKDARSADKKARARGDRLFTDEQRQAIDTMYDRFIHSHMRAIEDVPTNNSHNKNQTASSDAKITLDSMAKGTGFDNVADMVKSFNPEPTSQYDCAVADRNIKLIENARKVSQIMGQAIDQAAQYDVKHGDGFDRIARHVLTRETGAAPNEKDVVDFSGSIAKLNGFDRQKYDPKVRSIQPGQKIQVHDDNWKLMQKLGVMEEVADYIENNLE